MPITFSWRWTLLCAVLLLQAPGQSQTHAATTQASDPVAALLSLSDAVVRGDEPAIRQGLEYQGPTATALADALIAFDLAQARMRNAAHKAFVDQDISVLISGSLQANRQQLASARAQVEGNSATITVGDQHIVMVRVEGRWKRPVMAPVKGWSDAQVSHLIAELQHQARIYDGLVEDVEHGKFHTPRQAAEELREQLLKSPSNPTTNPTTRPSTHPTTHPAGKPSPSQAG